MIYKVKVEIWNEPTNSYFWTDAFVDFTKVNAIFRNESDVDGEECVTVICDGGHQLHVKGTLDEICAIWEVSKT